MKSAIAFCLALTWLLAAAAAVAGEYVPGETRAKSQHLVLPECLRYVMTHNPACIQVMGGNQGVLDVCRQARGALRPNLAALKRQAEMQCLRQADDPARASGPVGWAPLPGSFAPAAGALAAGSPFFMTLAGPALWGAEIGLTGGVDRGMCAPELDTAERCLATVFDFFEGSP